MRKNSSKSDARPAKRGASSTVTSLAGTGTVTRAVRMIAAVAAADSDVGVGELAKQLSLPVPTIHRLLHLLRKEGMVEWHADSHRYAIGPELYRIAAQVSAATTPALVAQREIAKLTQATSETALFGLYQPAATAMSFEARAEGTHALQYRIKMHSPLSLVWGASGKSILAFLPAEVIERALKNEKTTSQDGESAPALIKLQSDLARVRKNGFAVSEDEKLLGARGIAAPVFDRRGVLGCIVITSPKQRIPVNQIGEIADAVRFAAAQLSRSLGALEEPASAKRSA